MQAFATLFYISYTKLLFLVYIPFDSMDDKGKVLTILKSPTLIQQSLSYITSITNSWFSLPASLFSSPPIIILMVYSTGLCKRTCSHLSPRLNLALLTFVNTYQGWHKWNSRLSCSVWRLSSSVCASATSICKCLYTR